MSQLEPSLSPGKVTAAIYCELDGMIEPTLASAACIRAAIKHGASVMLETEVTGVTSGPNSATVITGNKTIKSDMVVLAGGVDNTRLAAMAGVKIPQQESPGVVIRTEAISGDLLTTAAIVYAPSLEPERPEIHFRQCLDGSVLSLIHI